ncbi:GNAT family N-acetyltransferase [Arcticibacterium luteifluviistationis]|uniref:GNAT family N-acetyltransferase n=1 Tax=Arcticibacterium luteifluviistationis TaxID=1784714 RepID=A0A2Z4GCU8_9BACT|nr:GNAT family N-acetyltransferase [Arcticibacterium luteifluviistationis]AWV98855.1 GNAT family N-acetyltransferase [Arcticibacterium luteifluviistationis]
MNTVIREAIAADVPAMMGLVKELALYEKAPEQVTNTEALMLKDGFGNNPIFGAFVAEVDGKVVGLSIYYYRYSTWKGRRIYLEDLVVQESLRGKGAGKMLFEAVIQKGKEEGCTGMMWQVLDWNKSAITFYEKYGAKFDEEWVNCKLDF